MSDETRAIRLAVFARERDLCAVCGRRAVSLDHFFGRAKMPQAVENCWALCQRCDFEKTNNRPDAETWLLRFREHVKRHGAQVPVSSPRWHGYTDALLRVDRKLAWVRARGAFNAKP